MNDSPIAGYLLYYRWELSLGVDVHRTDFDFIVILCVIITVRYGSLEQQFFVCKGKSLMLPYSREHKVELGLNNKNNKEVTGASPFCQ